MDLTRRYSIAYKGLKNGLHEYDFKVDGELFRFFESPDIKGGACDVHVNLKRSEGMLEADTVIDGSVRVECDRCLEEFDLPIHFEGHLVVRLSDEADDDNGEMMWLSPSQSDLGLMQYIYESIVLSLPYQKVHAEGQCNPDMLARFNIVSGAEFEALELRAEAEAEAEQNEAQDGEWAKLEVLREQMVSETAKSKPNDDKK